MTKPTVALLLLLVAGPLVAQDAPPQRPPQESEITLVYEREVFSYEPSGRRDPFGPLTSSGIGPRFEELTLQGIIYSTGAGRSVALLMDGGGQIHRVHVGDIVGNARVLEIGTLRVLFAVDEFGRIRQEFLELQRRATTGATGS